MAIVNNLFLMAINFTDKNDRDEIQVDEIRGQLSKTGFINRFGYYFAYL